MKNKNFKDLTKLDLEEMYINQHKSTITIAKIFNCNDKSIHYRLKKFGIKTRNLSESHLHGYSFSGDYDVLYGSLLGDGSLVKRNKKTNQGSVSFAKGNINYDHLLFVGKKLLNSTDTETRIKKSNNIFRLYTKACKEFSKEYDLWYPNDIKIVPNNLKINPKIVLHWFLDDGSSSWISKNSVSVHFCTESFSKNDCEFLLNQLQNICINARLEKINAGFGHRISISNKKSVVNFFNYIGKCPSEIRSMEYKWKLPKQN